MDNEYINDLVEISEDEFSEELESENDISAEASEDMGEKVEIVGIRFKKNGKTYYFSPNGYTLSQDDRVIVDTARGQEYGYTAVTNREIGTRDIVSPLREVIRLATDEDTKIHEENIKKEIEAYNACIALADEHSLKMKLIDVEMSFDRSKLLFYFSAEGRVDFRELVKDLAGKFHTRIEMRQIGIRDEAKILGGLGICGRPFCCSSFLSDFVQVSVKMAKEQNLSLNSAKISGSCGRLMCCLRYEYDTYLAEKALTPKVDTRVMTPSGAGIVTAANPLAGIVKVKLDMLPDDAEHAVFVREDVVKEDDYTGELLTKTELPKNSREKNDETMYIINDSVEEKSVAEPVTTESEVFEVDNQQNKKTESDGGHGGSRRNRHNRNRHRNRSRNENGGEQASGENKQKPAHESVAQNTEKAPDIKQSDGDPKIEKSGKSDKKRHKRPYYRNFQKKKTPKQDGQ